MGKLFQEYRIKREIAHKLLQCLLTEIDAEIFKKVGLKYFVTNTDGSTIFKDERSGIGKIHKSYVTYISLKTSLKKYSETELISALNLLLSNKHIEIEDTNAKSFDNMSFNITPKGRLAYDDLYYLNYEKEKWIDRNPIIYELIKGFITAGFAIVVTLLLSKPQQQENNQLYMQQEKRLDSLSNLVDFLTKKLDTSKFK